MLKRKDLDETPIFKTEDLRNAFYEALHEAYRVGKSDVELKKALKQLASALKPTKVLSGDLKEIFAVAAEKLEQSRANRINFCERKEKAPWKLWGTEKVEAKALEQMDDAVSLPISVGGALMPDAHQGYGLPIGGVLATKGAVIPYAVGVDIACRMRISILDVPCEEFERDRRRFGEVLLRETRFGVGIAFDPGMRVHEVMDDPLWKKPGVLKENFQKARSQLGTSGHGNHFVEFGKLTVEADIDEPTLKIKAGTYTALLSHSGSRGLGQHVAYFYSELAAFLHPELPENLKRLSWLELDSEEGKDYWEAMELCGRYAAANHELIHKHVIAALGCGVLGYVENHHNFAWKEEFNGEEVIVHRKGATPAGEGKLGVVPGSMGTPGFIVRGKGNPESFNSCSHGAGRVMSRAAAYRNLKREDMKNFLRAREVTLIGGTLDESPEVYKDINKVIAGQTDLVDVLAKFEPKVVRMAEEKAQWTQRRNKKKAAGEAEVCM